MAENRLETLVTRLHKRSIDRKLSWEDTAKENTYQCSFPDYTIQLSARPSQEEPDATDYFLSILNSDNVVIERINDMQLAQDFDEPGRAYKLMGEMFSAARRTALGTEAAIDALLEELGDE